MNSNQMPTQPRIRQGWLLLALISITFACSIERAAAQTTPPLTLEDLLRAYHVDEQAVDYFMVVDTSGSMLNALPDGGTRFEAARAAALELLRALKPRDYLSVLEFHSRANVLVPGRTVGEDISDIRALIDDWPTPKGSNSTDIGRALEETIRSLARPYPNAIQIVFFLTDGKHEPDALSPYRDPDASTWSPAWKELASKAPNATAGRIFRVVGLPIIDNTDIDYLRRVWPNDVDIFSAGSANAILRQMRDQVMVRTLAAYIASDLRESNVVFVPPQDPLSLTDGGVADVNISLRGKNSHLGLVVSEVQVTSKSGTWKAPAPKEVTREGFVTVGTFELSTEKWSLLDELTQSFLNTRRVQSIELTVSATGLAQPEDRLRNVLLAAPQWQHQESVRISLVVRSRIPTLLTRGVTVCVAAVVALAAFFARRNRVKGSLLVWPKGEKVINATNLLLDEARTVPILYLEGAKVSPHGGTNATTVVAEIHARRCGRVMEVVSHDPEYPIEPIGGTVLQLEDHSRFSVGGYEYEYTA